MASVELLLPCIWPDPSHHQFPWWVFVGNGVTQHFLKISPFELLEIARLFPWKRPSKHPRRSASNISLTCPCLGCEDPSVRRSNIWAYLELRKELVYNHYWLYYQWYLIYIYLHMCVCAYIYLICKKGGGLWKHRWAFIPFIPINQLLYHHCCWLTISLLHDIRKKAGIQPSDWSFALRNCLIHSPKINCGSKIWHHYYHWI